MNEAHEIIDFEPWLASLASGRSEADRELLRHAFDLASQAHANQKRASGEPRTGVGKESSVPKS